MTARPVKDAAFALQALPFGRLTAVGLVLAAIGWVLLLGEATVADVLAVKGPRPFGPTFHADLVDIAKSIIVSGFGLAIIGALQAGFGTLNSFFGAVLMRSTQRDNAARGPQESAQESPRVMGASIDSRPYRLLPDGSVEVETIVGTRVFRTMAEARDFI